MMSIADSLAGTSLKSQNYMIILNSLQKIGKKKKLFWFKRAH